MIPNPFEAFFQSLAQDTGFPIGQVRFVFLLLLSYPLGWVYRRWLHPAHTSLVTRYIYAIAFGLLFGYLCFGRSIYVMLGAVMVCYAILKWTSPARVQRYTMVWAMGSLSVGHIYRMVTDDGSWQVDFTIPFMIIVQKVTLVAFALHDGKARKDSSLNADQRLQKLDSCPSLLEYLGYTLNFHTLLAGPACTFKEYVAFVNGSNFQTGRDSDDCKAIKSKEPSAWFAVLSKLVYSLINAGLYVYLSSIVTTEDCWDPSHNLAQRIFIMYLNFFRLRTRYYFAWILADSINNLCGLGFNGYDKDGSPKWDLITNVHVLDIELATSLKGMVTGWNSLTANWLRRVCYERVTISPTLLTFGLSAWWHGFYPGYAFVFIYFAIQTAASRKMRRLVRPYFQTSQEKKWFYDAMTFFVTHIFVDYGVIFAIEFLRVDRGLRVWSAYYYLPVLVSVAALFLPGGTSSKSKDISEKRPSIDKTSNDSVDVELSPAVGDVSVN